MLPVEIVPVDGSTLVLRARGSELLILPQHIGQLKSCKSPKEFTGYFMESALLNRPARKLFEAWLRKDKSLWQRIYRTIQNEMEVDEQAVEEATTEEPVKAKAPEKPAKEEEEKPKAAAKKKTTKKSEPKKTAKKTTKKATKSTKTKKVAKTTKAKKTSKSSKSTKTSKTTKTKKTTKTAKKKVTKKKKA